MAEISKFFNAVEISPGVFDREYNASDFADFFGTVLSTGLIHTDNNPGLSVSVEAGTMNTVISTGKAIMGGYPYENTTPRTLTHNIPEATLDRIDRIILRLDLRNSGRTILSHIKEGNPSASPVPPDLQRDNFIYEISLAQVRVRKNTVQLLPTDLVDERLNEELCGLSYSLISIPTEQFQRQWDEFMAGIEDEGFATVDSVKTVDRKLTTHLADDVAHNRYGVATGTNVKILTLNPALASLTEGLSIRFKSTNRNTTAVTLNVNGLGAKPVLKNGGVALEFDNLKAGGIYTVVYDGTAFILQGEGGEYGNVTPSDVLAGKIFGTEEGLKIGTLERGKQYYQTSKVGNDNAHTINLPFNYGAIHIINARSVNRGYSYRFYNHLMGDWTEGRDGYMSASITPISASSFKINIYVNGGDYIVMAYEM